MKKETRKGQQAPQPGLGNNGLGPILLGGALGTGLQFTGQKSIHSGFLHLLARLKQGDDTVHSRALGDLRGEFWRR